VIEPEEGDLLVPLLQFGDGSLCQRVVRGMQHSVLFQVGAGAYIAGIDDDGWVPFEGWSLFPVSGPEDDDEVARRRVLAMANALGMLERPVKKSRVALWGTSYSQKSRTVLRPLFLEDHFLEVRDVPLEIQDPENRQTTLDAIKQHIVATLPKTARYLNLDQAGFDHRYVTKIVVPLHLVPPELGVVRQGSCFLVEYDATNHIFKTAPPWVIVKGGAAVSGGATLAEAVRRYFERDLLIPLSTEARWWEENTEPYELCGPLAEATESCRLLGIPGPAMWPDERLREALS
jgi:hypothetical protein